MASDADASYDDVVPLRGSDLSPVVTWGINPGQAIGVDERIPGPESMAADERDTAEDAYDYMGWKPGDAIAGTKIDVAFIGSCTNGRLSDLREAARIARLGKVKPHVKALVVPGSQAVARAAEAEGLHEVFRSAGFEWRLPGCSMCLAMNPDKLSGREICASSSNRNFKGRQGSPAGRTLLMSPAMVAAAAIEGAVSDVRRMLEGGPRE
jgi:3-isopropylmalate/(R)-2-methylmalate dehydratase large subunit